MISTDKPEATSNDARIEEANGHELTRVNADINSEDFRQRTNNDLVIDSRKTVRKARNKIHRPDSSSALMTAYINTVAKTLKDVHGEYLPAEQSGDIVLKSKYYLGSLVGNDLAKKYITNLMLVVRNNYQNLNEPKRDKLIDYLYSYHDAVTDPNKIQLELTELYKSGIKPL